MPRKSHVTPLGYAITFGVLLLLTGLTLGLSYVELGRWGVPVALVIASVKSLLVALFFMHLVEERTSNRLVAASAIVFVALLVSLMVLDVQTRPALDGDVADRPAPLAPPQRAASPP
jgi:cytochrome c oxidase subunit IV